MDFQRILRSYDSQCGECHVRKLTREECKERGITYKEEWDDEK